MVTGFVKMDNDLARRIIKDCGLGAMGFYYILLSHKNDGVDSCFPSNDCLMKECDITKPTLNRYIKSLIENGYLKVSSGNIHRASNYYFPLESDMYTDEELEKIKNITRRKGSNKKQSKKDISFNTDTVNHNKESDESKTISDEMIKKSLVNDLAIYYKESRQAKDLIDEKCNGRKFSVIGINEVREIYNLVKLQDDIPIN